MPGKLEKPIVIIMCYNKKVIAADEDCNKEYDLKPGVMLQEGHYGFVLVIEKNGKQFEKVFPTISNLVAINFEHNRLNIYEDGDKFKWEFDKYGNVLRLPFNQTIKLDNQKKEEIITIYLYKDLSCSIVEVGQKEYPIDIGVMFADGYRLIKLKYDNEEKTILTDECIEAIGLSSNGNFVHIYEKGRIGPSKFITSDGNILNSFDDDLQQIYSWKMNGLQKRK